MSDYKGKEAVANAVFGCLFVLLVTMCWKNGLLSALSCTLFPRGVQVGYTILKLFILQQLLYSFAIKIKLFLAENNNKKVEGGGLWKRKWN